MINTHRIFIVGYVKWFIAYLNHLGALDMEHLRLSIQNVTEFVEALAVNNTSQ